MTTRKKKNLPAKESYRPKNAVETQFIRVLDGWYGVAIDDPFDKAHFGETEYIISPERKVYRRAYSWETPTLVIDADILPAAHHIRLVRVTNKPLRMMAKRALRDRLRQQRTR